MKHFHTAVFLQCLLLLVFLL